MARLHGIAGGLSGKMGNVVFRQNGGQTVAAQYQPVVKNPNSNGQQAHRASFKLMSQLAAIMAPGFGSFIIKTRPEKCRPSKRNAFVALNFPLVQTDKTEEGVIAKIPMEELQLTSSHRYLGTISEIDTNVSVNVADAAVSVVRFVIITYIQNDITKPVISAIHDVPVSDMTASTSITTNTPPHNITVLAYGLIPTKSASKIVETSTLGLNTTTQQSAE